MVGSVLMQRMQQERDFDHVDPVFFTTSQVGGKAPAIGKDVALLKDARERAATIPMRFSRGCARKDGAVTGSMRLLRCACRRTP